MRIMHVVESFGGGVYSFLVSLCNGISNEHEIIIVYSKRKETPKDFKKDFKKNIKFIYLDMCRGFNLYKNIYSLYSLKEIIKDHKPDIVHLHSSKAGFIGRVACKQIKFNMNNVLYNPHGFSFLQKNENKLKRRIYFELERYAAKLGGIIIGCSKGETNQANKISKHVVNINNGIDTFEIDKLNRDSDVSKSSNSIVIGTSGRISNQKNPFLFNKIAEYYPQYRFVWIGDGELKNELKSQNIAVTGWKEKKEVISELVKLDIFIMTSLWEGLPIALLEAMYLGKPVVVSNVIGNNDVVKSNENGYLAKDFNEFIKHLNILIEDKQYRKEISNNAFKAISEQFTADKMIENYCKIYNSLIIFPN